MIDRISKLELYAIISEMEKESGVTIGALTKNLFLELYERVHKFQKETPKIPLKNMSHQHWRGAFDSKKNYSLEYIYKSINFISDSLYNLHKTIGEIGNFNTYEILENLGYDLKFGNK